MIWEEEETKKKEEVEEESIIRKLHRVHKGKEEGVKGYREGREEHLYMEGYT